MIESVISHYRIIEELGQGGMGVVYKAEDSKLNRPVALKFLPPDLTRDKEANRRFVYEAQTASALDHQNVCTIHEIDESDDGRTFICMAYYEGLTLKQKIAQGPLQIEEALDITIQIARGLAKAHEKGIIHRDIKPANIIVQRDGTVKIIDFGLSKLAGVQNITKSGSTMGTVAYMSGEQALGKEVDHRSDIWSLGVVLYEMLTGHQPYKAKYDETVVYKIINKDPKPVTALCAEAPAELEMIVNKALAKNAGQRYQEMQEILDDLKSITESTKPERMQTSPTRAKSKRGKRIFLYSIVTALLIVLIVGGLYLFTGRSETIDSIVVLPLENLSGDPKQDYFVDGMTEALITNLGKIGALRVISRTSAMYYKKTNKPLPQIAKELNVDAVVEGSVMRVGERVRITALLIKAQPEQHLWAETYERDLRDILTLQSNVARAIANEIRVKLTPKEQKRLSTVRPVNPEAYEFYALGRYLLNTGFLQAQKNVLKHFQTAFEKDPNYALAYSGLARTYNFLGNIAYQPPNEVSPKAKAAALKALEFDDELAEAHTQLAFVKMNYDWDWAGAESELKRAIELNPGLASAHSLYAWYLTALGRFREGLARMKQALELDPLSPGRNRIYGWHLHMTRQYDRAITQFRKTVEMDSTSSRAHQNFGRVYEQKGMYTKAIAEFQKAMRLSGGKTGYIIAALGHAYAISGNEGEAQRVLNDLNELSEQKYISSYDVAVIYAGLGEKDEAFMWLEKAYEQRDGWLAGWLKVDPRFDPLHDDPRFIELLKKIGLEE